MSSGHESTPGDELAERHDPLWRLLARSPLPEPEAWFTARTLARARQEKRSWVLFARVRRWMLGAAGVSVAVALLAGQIHTEQAKQQNVQEALQILASVDSDSDTTPSTSLPQDSSL